MKIGAPKTIKVSAKTSDCFSARLYDQDGLQIGGDYDGYVPDFFPKQHYGDYLILDIDIETGQITNWKKPEADELMKVFCGEAEED